MDHSTAILEDAGKVIEKQQAAQRDMDANGGAETAAAKKEYDDGNIHPSRKRKGNFEQHGGGQKHGSRGRNSRGGRERDGDNKRHKKGDMGRTEYFASNPDKRAKTQSAAQRRDAGEGNQYGQTFSKDEIDAEERRPKRKVAVFIGYSGTGYKGMQISTSEKTIEGDLFEAFVKAGAISKANADDPKKASLVRCARTDKGVHAAGNMISLKLIVEDDDIVEKINAALNPQIRVWGIERTIGSFSCYQACDSRWYEYLIPSYAFLPPHPSSWLAKQLVKLADEAGDTEGFQSRQEEVQGFWEKVDDTEIKTILEEIDEDIRWEVVKALQGEEEASAKAEKPDADVEPVVKTDEVLKSEVESGGVGKAQEAAIVINEPSANEPATAPNAEAADTATQIEGPESSLAPATSAPTSTDANSDATSTAATDRVLRLRAATKKLRIAYNTAKRRYRIPQRRLERIQQALNNYVGTKNYHNYTIQKTFRDPSSKRNIKSFVANTTPILIDHAKEGEEPNADSEKSEWLSLKVHGQSFMMHQIRKMIGMVTLLVRCGADIDKTMAHSFTDARYSIPKVPGLGLMLERPVFDSYNQFQAPKHDRPKLLFSKFNDDIEAFKRKEIYAKMFREEEEKGEFGRFFQHVDNFREGYFLWLSSKGLEATQGRGRKEGYGEVRPAESEDEGGSGGEM